MASPVRRQFSLNVKIVCAGIVPKSAGATLLPVLCTYTGQGIGFLRRLTPLRILKMNERGMRLIAGHCLAIRLFPYSGSGCLYRWALSGAFPKTRLAAPVIYDEVRICWMDDYVKISVPVKNFPFLYVSKFEYSVATDSEIVSFIENHVSAYERVRH